MDLCTWQSRTREPTANLSLKITRYWMSSQPGFSHEWRVYSSLGHLQRESILSSFFCSPSVDLQLMHYCSTHSTFIVSPDGWRLDLFVHWTIGIGNFKNTVDECSYGILYESVARAKLRYNTRRFKKNNKRRSFTLPKETIIVIFIAIQEKGIENWSILLRCLGIDSTRHASTCR